MEIKKSLNINRTPQAVENNSLICAKNIKISTDGQYITNEEGIKVIYDTNDSTTKVVGVIPCNKELVIFTCVTANYNTSKIFRINEDGTNLREVPNGWRWSGGVIKGDYTYNVNNELIVAIAESGVDGKDIPLKTINLDTSKSTDKDHFYNSSPNVPIGNLAFKGYSLGSGIPQGTYQFFIRYSIDNSTKTKWFPCSIPIIAVGITQSTIIESYYKKDNVTGGDLVRTYVNNDSLCNYNFNLELNIEGNDVYKECELAYTIQHDNGVFGRKWRTIKLEPNTSTGNSRILTFDKASTIEVGVDELTDNAFNLYNVKNVCNYNNRLYISNYKENEPKSNLAELAAQIEVSYDWKWAGDGPNEKAEDVIMTDIKSRLQSKTLIPNQVYNFFIHYVYPDGSYTNGYKISYNDNVRFYIGDLGFLVYNNLSSITGVELPEYLRKLKANFDNYPIFALVNNATSNKFGYYRNSDGEVFHRAPDFRDATKIFYPKFTNITVPAGYSGYFISYEEVEDIVKLTGMNGIDSRYYDTPGVDWDQSYLRLNSTENVVLGKDYSGLLYYPYKVVDINGIRKNSYIGDKVVGVEALESKAIAADNIINDNQGREAFFSFELTNLVPPQFNNSSTDFSDGNQVGAIIAIDLNIYSNKNKKLISLGQIKYSDPNSESINQTYGYDNYIYNLEGYLAVDNLLVYNKNGVIIGDDGITTDIAGKAIIKAVNNYRILKYSKYFLDAYSINNAPKVIIGTSTGSQKTNKVVRPADSTDLFTYKKELIPEPVKSYYKFDPLTKYVTSFNRTIRRSDVIRSESFDNSWKNFRPDAYKVITENKGNITNIVGVGLYLLVHTEHSLFMFNRDASLKTDNKDVQLFIPDAFDTEYQEVFTSNKGYGGLQDGDAYAVNEFGYFFYDGDGKAIYNFDNGQLKLMSIGISEFIHNFDIHKATFALNRDNNRLVICFRLKDYKYVTISYSFLINDWSSLHDYHFEKAYNTKNKTFYLLKRITNNEISYRKLYTYDDSTICKFGDLQFEDSSIFPVYQSDQGDIAYSYVDVICNQAYERIKSLEFLSYLTSEILGYGSVMNQAEAYVNRRYSGYQLILYSDCTNSGLLDIDCGNAPNKFDNYKYPFFDKGRWNLNYFRNYVERAPADDKSLIYGKYIVARFIFNNSVGKRIKFENIEFSINPY